MTRESIQQSHSPRPVLKWAGGKRQLIPQLMKNLPDLFGTYYEPFVGGGALFFELSSRGKISKALLSDINPSLIDVYLAVRDNVDQVIELLKQYRHEEAYYYQIRSLDPGKLSLAEKAARIIYLNKTCYNGLFRENRSGQFNVPFGHYKNPKICDEPNLRAVSRLIRPVEILCRHFSTIIAVAQPGDFVYFDPPYHPISATANFTSYDRNGFGEKDQIKLRDIFTELTRKGIKAMLSNSDTPFIRGLYSDYKISRVYASRPVSSKSSSRGKVAEVIICNYDLPNLTENTLSYIEEASTLELQRKEAISLCWHTG